jgi:hypothetical protein
MDLLHITRISTQLLALFPFAQHLPPAQKVPPQNAICLTRCISGVSWTRTNIIMEYRHELIHTYTVTHVAHSRADFGDSQTRMSEFDIFIQLTFSLATSAS